MNPMLLYRKRQNAIREFDRNANTPAVMNNKLEALRVLANSILSEVASLEQDRDVMVKNDIDLSDEVPAFRNEHYQMCPGSHRGASTASSAAPSHKADNTACKDEEVWHLAE
jgi:hypothetical protein